ncbi:hypothetical protein KP79_PYT12348 [Mizuhopecten yessoensis]|uniref:PH domain-containing protein n=1 Tax=Mizuhopecten yessoensis TaxID=6573 RepID=A0A210QR11_MIZYE|nr:hypothetical protein KP79_PYT12348 [Mizuhopecten yessoensis]
MSVEVEQKQCTCQVGPCPATKGHGDYEVKAGHLFLLRQQEGVTVNVPVFVRVYRSCFEHYAVVCRSQTLTNNSLYVSLKTCVVVTSPTCDRDIVVIPDNAEGGKVTFKTTFPDDVSDWIAVLQPTQSVENVRRKSNPLIMPKSPLMPMLQELNEDTDA